MLCELYNIVIILYKYITQQRKLLCIDHWFHMYVCQILCLQTNIEKLVVTRVYYTLSIVNLNKILNVKEDEITG